MEQIYIDAAGGNVYQKREVEYNNHGRKLYEDTECPASEMYVGFVETKTTNLNNSLVISDIELRKGDRM